MQKLGIDIDGVLANFDEKFVSLLRTELKVDIKRDFQPTDWGWTNANLEPGIMDRAWEIIDSTPCFWETLSPTSDIISMAEFFHEYADKKYEIYFITARKDGIGRGTREQSERWLRENLINPKQTITVLPVKSGLDKAEIIYALHLDYSIDDHTPTVVNNKTIKDHHAFLLDKPWNQDGKFYSLKTVKTLKEFFNQIERKIW
jgi:hypothetical protein